MLRKTGWLCTVFLLILSCGCTSQFEQDAITNESTTTFFAMDTVMELMLYGDPLLLERAESRVTELETLLSVTDEGSEIYAINHGGSTKLSDDTSTLLSVGLELCRRTEGALDLSIYPVVRAWGFTTGNYRIPDSSELAELLSCVNYEWIHFDRGGQMVELEPNLEIDLGSIAKGYTGDQLIALFKEAGVTSALLNLGGNVQTLGSKPDGTPWRIAVKDPLGDGNLGVLSVANCAVITSGGYERYFEADGQTYWHIIDPATGCPARNGLISVTVVGESGVLCDGLSTALFVMGPEAAATFWQEADDFEAVFVMEDGNVSITEGLTSCFSLVDSYAGSVISVISRD